MHSYETVCGSLDYTCPHRQQHFRQQILWRDYIDVQARLSLFVCLFALRPKSTAMVIAGRSVHLTTLFPGQA